MEGKAKQEHFPAAAASAPLLSQPSVMCACVHWGLQLVHQTHSSRGSTPPLQYPFLILQSLRSSKETGNL